MFGLLSSQNSKRVMSTRGMSKRMRAKSFEQLAEDMGFTSRRQQKHIVKAFEENADSKRRELSKDGLETALKDLAVKRGNGIAASHVQRAARRSEYGISISARSLKEHQKAQYTEDHVSLHDVRRKLKEERQLKREQDLLEKQQRQEAQKLKKEEEKRAREEQVLEMERKMNEKEELQQKKQDQAEKKQLLKEQRLEEIHRRKEQAREVKEHKIEQQKQVEAERTQAKEQELKEKAERAQEKKQKQEERTQREQERKENVRAANDAHYARSANENRYRSSVESSPESPSGPPNLITNYSGLGAARYAGAAQTKTGTDD